LSGPNHPAHSIAFKFFTDDEFGAVDPNWMGSETYNAWAAHLKSVADLKPIVESATSEEEPETPLAKRIRTGAQEPSELAWVNEELQAWLKASPDEPQRVVREFVSAFSEESDRANDRLVQRLLSGVHKEDKR
jgi:hypothetical protein